VRKLLRDREPGVRLAVARELAQAGEKESVPVLIELLAQLPAGEAGPAEELLYRLAGAAAPRVPPGEDPAGREKCRDAWRAWWREHGGRLKMDVLTERERVHGYTLLVLLDAGSVVEWGRDGKPRWQVGGLSSPLDAEVLPGGRVLIAEAGANRVTERRRTGEVVWEKKLPGPPVHAQRLPNGNTFVVTAGQVLEVDRSGKEAVRYGPGKGITTARRFRDGRIGCVRGGEYVELDATGRERRRFPVGGGVFTTNALTLLPNGNVLVVAYGEGAVREYDRAGKVVWQAKVSRPLCALRLPGGNTVVSSQDQVLVECDRAGKEVGRRPAKGHACQIRRR
jgi:hypothetical protein